MEQVQYDLNSKICAIYLDNILIWSSLLDEHLERLDAVFKRFAEGGLKLKPSMCSGPLKIDAVRSFERTTQRWLNYLIIFLVNQRRKEVDPTKIMHKKNTICMGC